MTEREECGLKNEAHVVGVDRLVRIATDTVTLDEQLVEFIHNQNRFLLSAHPGRRETGGKIQRAGLFVDIGNA